jgi:hypothetical protein
MLIVGKNVHLAELEFSDLSDLADALAVPFVTSILESSYDGIFNLLGIELPSATSWCFQDVDAESNQEQLQAQDFDQCQQTATDLISKKILVSMILSDVAAKSFMDSYGCLLHWDVVADTEEGTDISEVCESIANA